METMRANPVIPDSSYAVMPNELVRYAASSCSASSFSTNHSVSSLKAANNLCWKNRVFDIHEPERFGVSFATLSPWLMRRIVGLAKDDVDIDVVKQ